MYVPTSEFISLLVEEHPEWDSTPLEVSSLSVFITLL